ncbi:hypothetical protein [Acinetobacter sp. Ac_5812]|uniref:hypothetical protein n=1 Tax=Acinetobacter sp. Ac_5812 TaxID=1848937 RepID=UPI00148F4F0C|nr:hypothetical protein [Acinetobacter sp. Ac_5812]NNP70396.1 hypothetical protein [Acinetobacter sp. Ac_5812]
MKYFKDSNGQVHALESDGSQDHLILKDMKMMTKIEIDHHLYPENYLTEDEKNRNYLNSLQPLERRQFLRALVEYNEYENLKKAIGDIGDNKQRSIVEIELNESRIFGRLNEYTLIMFSLIGFDETKINDFWEHGLLL